MKVWVLWDGVYECVVSAHSTEEQVLAKIDDLCAKGREDDRFRFSWDEFEVEE